ncbi:ATPase GET3D, chloroplastic isoform X2 [Rutidosis leptorrhynchoides]|uniref:ATPase GET3D, chloroplastic isoform X2 n=1 Tax=Rutidosis leptorrhynchoides TaxID=125765 RepID=UPI003A997149
MAYCNSNLFSPASSFSFPLQFQSNINRILVHQLPPRFHIITMAKTSTTQNNDIDNSSTKFVTFLGKGGSGKTFSAVFAAQHYAMAGLKTCLVIHSQDPTADYILNCKIGTIPITCNDNLSAVRLETTKMILEPLSKLKQADARLNLTQGVLEGVVGEELGVLPGMDTIFSALELEKLVGFLNNKSTKSNPNYDIIVYDGLSAAETIRMIGATGKSRLYLKYMRMLAEKTDFGRLAGPSILRLVDESLNANTIGSGINGKLTGEIWDKLENMLEKGSSFITKPELFGCYLVMDLNNPMSINTALRFWGSAVQAGALLSGAFGVTHSDCDEERLETAKKTFLPLPFASYPSISFSHPLNWNDIMHNDQCNDARGILGASKSGDIQSVTFDPANRSVTLYMPGFDKSEIKLYQRRIRVIN